MYNSHKQRNEGRFEVKNRGKRTIDESKVMAIPSSLKKVGEYQFIRKESKIGAHSIQPCLARES